MPLLSEYIYNNIKNIQNDNKESILLEAFPKSNEFKIDIKLENKFNRISETMRLIRSVRYKLPRHTSLKAPVNKLCILHNNEDYINDIKTFDEIIREELNIIDIDYYKLSDNINYKLEPNRKNLGKKYKSNANKYGKYLQELTSNYISSNLEMVKSGLLIDEEIKLDTEDYDLIMLPNPDLFKDMESIIEGELMISLDKRYDESIHNVYLTRSLITNIQRIRRNADLNPWNEINIYIKSDESFMKLLENKHKEMEERLKAHVKLTDFDGDIYAKGDIILYRIDQTEINVPAVSRQALPSPQVKVQIKIERIN
jgi:isoleucyl-tRNA synthetase